jgi:hypothetical protein
MYFYFLSNNSDKTKDELIKIFTYGCLAYIITHLLISWSTKLNTYFWLILTLDIISVYVLNTKDTNNGLIINDNFQIKNYNSEEE